MQNPCKNGGVCNQHSSDDDVALGEYTCTCSTASHYFGTNCEGTIDWCGTQTRRTPCQNGGTCTAGQTGYSCTCAGGFDGTNCNIDSTPPVTCTADQFNGGAVIDHSTSTANATDYTVTCEPGYHPVGANAYVCDKGTWVSGNDHGQTVSDVGLHCEDFDECGSSPCQHGGNCTESNTPGADVAVGEYACACAAGFANGRHHQCETVADVNPCDSSPCEHEGSTCAATNYGTDFECTCLLGYEGKTCDVDTDECLSAPCHNGGVCSESSSYGSTVWFGEYACACNTATTGYSGSTCDSNVDDCHSSPCRNGGVCADNDAGFTCNCGGAMAVATGPTCATEVNPCLADSPCKNNGTCVHVTFSGPTATCDCSTALHHRGGATCSDASPVAVVPCHSNPCANAGSCNPAANNASEFTCTCSAGFEGNLCTGAVETDPCASSPCAHGHCTKTTGTGYSCGTVADPATCPSGWGGKNCGRDVDECDPNPCHHDGTCTESSTDPSIAKGEYTCACSAASGFGGERHRNSPIVT